MLVSVAIWRNMGGQSIGDATFVPSNSNANEPELDQHLQKCKEDCAGCRLAKNYRKWRQRLSEIPWLAFKKRCDGTLGVGCLLCAFAGSPSPAACFEMEKTEVRLSKLKRHEQTDAHRKAWQNASASTGLPGPPAALDSTKDAPPCEVFEAALKRRLDGLACQAGLPDHGIGPDKLRQLTFCLAEAKRMMLRAWILDNSVTIALQQDERHQRLLLRFTAASGRLERKSGVIGLAKNFGSAAGSISQATEKVIRAFCTPGSWAPGVDCSSFPINDALLEAFRQKTEVFVADNAGDEQKAGELLRHKRGEDGASFLPSLRLGLRDAAHASRRIIKRPFEADPTLAEIMQSVFFGKHSIVAAVENSILLKNRFEHHCSKFAKLPSIRSLSLAKQRFDSTQKPIRRLCLYLVPFLLTVIELSREKKNDENGQRASAFLAYCSEEILVQIGMIADAGDEGGQLCRAFDKELPASEELAATLSNFEMKISCLFAADEPACLLTGYTNHMICTLQERELLLPTLDGNGVRTLGGPQSITAPLVERCLSRMRVWVKLAKACIAHEFPEWDLITSFQVFNVTAERSSLSNQTREKHIRRLSKFFDVDLLQFRSQLDDLTAIARVHAQNTSCTSLSAWQHTVQEVLSTQKRRDRHPCDVLQVVLARWAGWSSSSCGVEQSFGHSTHFATARQSHASEAAECNDMVLLLDHDVSTQGQLVSLARKVGSL